MPSHDRASGPVNRHGDTCECWRCGHVRFLLAAGHEAEAVHLAASCHLLTEADFETAWTSGAPVLSLAGFTPRPEERRVRVINYDLAPEILSALTEAGVTVELVSTRGPS